jgi:uncharacterized protein YdaU (DUF1376 family)
MTSLPYMQLYVSDYLADTAHLTAQQHGAYMLLLMNYWQRGKALDNSNERLSHVARLSPEEWADAKPTLEEFFIVEGNLWTHTRVEDDLEKIREKSAKASFAGKRSVVARNLNERSTNAEQALNHKEEDKEEEEDKDINKNNLFDEFWKIYPLKVGKGAALKAFQKAIRTTDADIIIKGALRYKLDPNRVEGYTAHASTWLNAQRWLDEPLPQRNLSPDEKKEKELQEARIKSQKEKEEAEQWFRDQEEARRNAVPPPAELRELLRKSFTK